MISKSLKRINRVLFFFILLFTGLYFAASILIPLAFGILFAMLMHKMANYFENRGMGRGASSTICTLIVFFVLVGLGAMLTRQLTLFTEDIPQLMDQLAENYNQIRQFIYENFGFSYLEQEQFLEERREELANNAGDFIQSALEGLMSAFLGFLLVLIYMFLMLLNRDKYEDIIALAAKEDVRGKSISIAKESSNVAQKYLWGRIQVMIVLGILYLITFLSFGLEYAVLLTIFGTLITIIPYLGPFISGIAPILIAIITGVDFTTIIVLAVLVFIIQLIESYVLEPVLMGSEVNLSPLSIIFILLVGNAVWGIAGMILFVPMLAMAKIYFDHMEDLKPYGRLIGSNGKDNKSMFENLINKFRG
ncbi:MAG: AI-2E family transporter [Balneolaceae bacterium]